MISFAKFRKLMVRVATGKGCDPDFLTKAHLPDMASKMLGKINILPGVNYAFLLL